MIIDGLVYGLVSAWILSIFGVDDIFIDSLQSFVHGINFGSLLSCICMSWSNRKYLKRACK